MTELYLNEYTSELALGSELSNKDRKIESSMPGLSFQGLLTAAVVEMGFYD